MTTQEVQEIISKQLETYKISPDNFISAYNRELELTKEYNGRQILELLQNADDAQSDAVLIRLDKAEKILSICNKGDKPFETDGIKSLMIANLSNKTKIEYIGNKGLGFRSILNWSDKITIRSGGCEIIFSIEIAKSIFENELGLTIEQQKQIIRDRNLTDKVIPFPILAIPQLKEITENTEWTTIIEIKYREEYENDIKKQVNEFQKEVLLFLNHIQQIIIQLDDIETNFECKKKSYPDYETATIDTKQWIVYSIENKLPDEHQDKNKAEKQRYKIKVAFQESLSNEDSKLYNYFPTQHQVSLPCIINATFDLDSSRKHLNNIKQNEYILQQTIELLKSMSEHFTKTHVDWNAYKFLTPTSTNSDSDLIKDFYRKLIEERDKLSIFPCITQQYCKKTEFAFYGDAFSVFFQNHFPNIFPNLLIPNDIFTEKRFYNENEFVKKINTLSDNPCLTIPLRSQLIKLLIDDVGISNIKFDLLINEQNIVIPNETTSFTPSESKDFQIPGYVKIDFLNQELYQNLLRQFDIKSSNEQENQRDLQRRIKNIVNILPYDKNNIVNKIILETNFAIKKDEKQKYVYIKQMVKALYSMYNREQNRHFETTIPLVTEKMKIIKSTDMFLSKTYPSGEITDFIYGNILDENYLVNINFWNFKNGEDKQNIENFFLYLGVNKYSKINETTLSWNDSFVSKKKPTGNVNWSFRECKVRKIENFQEIKQLEATKILLLALIDGHIRDRLYSHEVVQWSYANYWEQIQSKVSYITYQFIQSKIFTGFLLDDIANENSFQIDYTTLENHGFNRSDVNSTILKLGGKENFEDLSPSKIFDILAKLPEKEDYKGGKGTQAIYKRALDSLSQATEVTIPADLKLFAKKGNESGYFPNNEVYYSDNSILPKQVLSSFPIFNMPKRAGESNVARCFDVKKLTDIKIEINKNSIKISHINSEWTNFFDSLKPYILAYRIEKIKDKSTQKSEARAIKQCRINIITDGLIQFENKEQAIAQNEYINEQDNFYFKSNWDYLPDLKNDFAFCDAFAEIINIIFEINDLQAEFKNLLRDTNYAKHTLEQDFNDSLRISFELLGIPKIEVDFWQKVFNAKNPESLEAIENSETLKTKIKNILQFDLPDTYSKINFESFEDRESYSFLSDLCNQLAINLQDIDVSLYEFHKKQFENEITTQKENYNKYLWVYLSDKTEAEQKKYIEKLRDYNNLIIDNDDFISKCGFEFNIDYKAKLFEWINIEFGIDCNIKLMTDVVIKSNYPNIDESELPEEERSLLFFSGHEDKFVKPESEEASVEDISTPPIAQANELLPINTIKIEAVVQSNNNLTGKTSGRKTGRIYSSGYDRQKKEAGKKAEQSVYNSFINKYGKSNVQWISGYSNSADKNDACGYDMKYREKNTWRYLEVKSVLQNQFFLTKREKEFAEIHCAEYDFALVENDQINIVRFSEIKDFESMIAPNEYIVNFKNADL
jgi:hypothetical protein